MYRLGRKQKKRNKWPFWIAGVGWMVGGLALLGWFAIRLINPHTTVQQSKAVVTKVAPTKAPVRTFDEVAFQIDLPSDWKLVTHLNAPYNLYKWQGSLPSTTNQIIEVYQDTIPENFPVNRVLPVEPSANQVSTIGTISDNCADFTKTAPTPGAYGVRAKWQGVDFLCDMTNYQRHVVGTSSVGGLNSVKLKAPNGTVHNYFFSYTDNNINPDYTSFYNALNSFKLK